MTIKYPIKKIQSNKINSSGKRGMHLESDINLTNQYYLDVDKAVIHKKPTPIQVVDVSYPSRNRCVIKEAYYKIPSTTDYNGIYKGKYIDFEAKETSSTTSFPLKNIHAHQIEHLKKVIKHGGIAFLLISFTNFNEVYLIKASDIIILYENQIVDRKSLSYVKVKEIGFLVKEGFNPRLDYLKIVDEIFL